MVLARTMSFIRSFLLLAVLGYSFCQDGENTATVEFPGLTKVLSDKCDLPRHLHLLINTIDDTISLNLTRSADYEIPVFVWETDEDGTPKVVSGNAVDETTTVLYQGDHQDAEFEVICLQDGQQSTLILDGFLEIDEQLYYLMESNVSNVYTLTEEKLDPSQRGIDDFDIPTKRRFIRSVGDREKRAITQNIYVDVFALVEYSVYQRWYSRSTETTDARKKTGTLNAVRRHFAHIFNAVDLRYKTASPKINVNLVGLLVDDKGSGEWFEKVRRTETDKSMVDAGKILDSLIELSKSPGFPKHDHLTSFESVNIYYLSDGQKQDLLGLANFEQTCVENGASVSTIKYTDRFIEDVATMTHELGHSLGAEHDGEDNSCSSDNNYIMAGSPGETTNTNPFKFSTCSAKFFDGYINGLLNEKLAYSSACLLQSLQANSVPDVGDKLPGQIYTLDQQCQMIFGAKSSYCKGVDDSNVCLSMYCTHPKGGCVKDVAARGSTCGENKWCEGGECVPITTNTNTNPNTNTSPTSSTSTTTTKRPTTATTRTTTITTKRPSATTEDPFCKAYPEWCREDYQDYSEYY